MDDFPSEPLRISRWKGGAGAAISLYYDDGTDSAFDFAVPSLLRLRLPGTFYLCCGWYGGPDDPKLARWGALARRHPEIVLGEHTWGHGGGTSAEEFADAVSRNGALLRKLAGLPRRALLSFGRPGGCAWTIPPEEEAAVLAAHGEFLRHGFGPENAGGPPGLHKDVGMHSFADACAILDRAEAAHGWEALLFHGVGGDWIAFPASDHERLLGEIDRRRAAGRLWCGSAIAVHKYAAERDAARLEPRSAPGNALAAAALSVATDPEVFDEPLTVLARVPAGCDGAAVDVVRDDGTVSLRVPAVDGAVRFDVPPRSALLVLR
ncbi:MAG: hypothetical protein IJL06_11165 [Kiritimatiellae bacterium]|nr:hypothetical protein [Kiritimatiellia bacterium]